MIGHQSWLSALSRPVGGVLAGPRRRPTRSDPIDRELNYMSELSEKALIDLYNSLRGKMKHIETDKVAFGKKKDGRGHAWDNGAVYFG